MSTDNIFENKESQVTPEQKEVPAEAGAKDPLETLLSQIRREDGSQKYATVEDALIGQVHAQKTIFELKKETTEKDSKMSEYEQRLAELEELKQTVAALTQKKDEQTSVKPFSEEDIQKQVSKAMLEVRTKEMSEQNIKSVLTTLNDKFGDKAESEFYSKGQELGYTAEEMNALAASKPKAVFAILGLNEDNSPKQPTINPSTGSLNTAGLKPKSTTYIRSERLNLPTGSGDAHLVAAADDAQKMVEELEARGLSIMDLTRPSNYNKIFKTR